MKIIYLIVLTFISGCLLSASLPFIKGIFTFDPGVTFHYYKTTTDQLNLITSDAYSFIRPDFRVLMKLKESETLRLIFRSTRQFTDINNLAEGFIFRNYNSFFRGNSIWRQLFSM